MIELSRKWIGLCQQAPKKYIALFKVEPFNLGLKGKVKRSPALTAPIILYSTLQMLCLVIWDEDLMFTLGLHVSRQHKTPSLILYSF